MTVDIYQPTSMRERIATIHRPGININDNAMMNHGGAGKIASVLPGRHPLQARNPNTIGPHASYTSHNSSTEEYNSKDMASATKGISTLVDSSHNENNKRLQNSGISHSNHNRSTAHANRSLGQHQPNGHLQRSSSIPELREGSEPNLPAVPHPIMAERSNSLPTTTTLDEDSVIIEEKRRRVNGEGYTLHRYLRGRLLGKGGFAKVYLCTALDTNKAYAIKIVPKANLTKARARQKLQAEIKIHRTLKHKNVCEYKHFFEDRQNCYILLELCHNQSMNEMIKRRKRLTEPETRYFMAQLLEAVKYLHEQLVIHRDLKLGNLFLDKELNIKVGDLGLATKLQTADEKRKTICGTPNYIAPEIIQGNRATRGHSFEVDVWSMGVIMFTCLFGKPPYEAKDVKATYQRILANEYQFPDDIQISDDAKDLIYRMLQSKPTDRPALHEIGHHSFFTAHHIPRALPSNATHVAPKVDVDDSATPTELGYSQPKSLSRPAFPKPTSQRLPFGARDANVEAHRNGDRVEKKTPVTTLKPKEAATTSIMDVQGVVKNAWCAVMNAATATSTATPQSSLKGFQVFDETERISVKEHQSDFVARTSKLDIQSPTREQATTPMINLGNDAITLHNMVDRISTVLEVVSQRSYTNVARDSPSLTPFTLGGPSKWVARYVDYTSKYGLGYLLNDGSSGVYFNDSTKTVLEAKGEGFHYIERKKNAKESPHRCEPTVVSYTLSHYPDSLNKKVTLLNHFRNYLLEQQNKSDNDEEQFKLSNHSNGDRDVVYLKKWVRTKHAIFFRLSDQTVQIVFYDHTEILLTHDERHITYVDKSKNRFTYYLTDELVGCNEDISKRLRYTKEILQQLAVGAKR